MKFSDNHPCFQGHFDLQAIVPGAYLLSLALDYVHQQRPELTSIHVVQAKFPHSLMPNVNYLWQLLEQSESDYIIRAKNTQDDQQVFLQARLKGKRA